MKHKLFGTTSNGTVTIVLPDHRMDAFFNDDEAVSRHEKIYFAPGAYALARVVTCTHWMQQNAISSPTEALMTYFYQKASALRSELLSSRNLPATTYIAVKIIKTEECNHFIIKCINDQGFPVYIWHIDVESESSDLIDSFFDAVINMKDKEMGRFQIGLADIDDIAFEAFTKAQKRVAQPIVMHISQKGFIWVASQPLKVYDGWIVPAEITSQVHYDELKAEIERMYHIEDDLPETARTYMKKINAMLADWKEPAPAPIAEAPLPATEPVEATA